jgi:predicted phosphodiesterase
MAGDDVRIGLLSDCEGSTAPLQAALAALKKKGCDVIAYAGDILACPFSPDPPGQTIGLLRAEETVQAIPGNNDRYLMDWGTPRWPQTLWMRLRRSDPAGPWLEDLGHGQALIHPDDLAWLRALPEEILVTDGVWVCHGMPGNAWNTIWPRSPSYDGNVSESDRDASLRMLAQVGAELVLCGHVPEPKEYHDHLPDGRSLTIVRAGPRDNKHVGYALLTRRRRSWSIEWDAAPIARHL